MREGSFEDVQASDCRGLIRRDIGLFLRHVPQHAHQCHAQ